VKAVDLLPIETTLLVEHTGGYHSPAARLSLDKEEQTEAASDKLEHFVGTNCLPTNCYLGNHAARSSVAQPYGVRQTHQVVYCLAHFL